MTSAATHGRRSATRAVAARLPAPSIPPLVPLLRPLSPRAAALHQIRNRLAYIAGTARTLRRRVEKGTLEPRPAANRLQRVEQAAWEIESALQSLPE